MNDIDLAEFKELYLKTAKEYLESMREQIEVLSQNSLTKENVEKIYISAHSLKSQSIVMGYTLTATLSGMIEKSFKAVKENSLTIDEGLVSLLKNCISKLQESITSIEQQGREIDLGNEISELERATNITIKI